MLAAAIPMYVLFIQTIRRKKRHHRRRISLRAVEYSHGRARQLSQASFDWLTPVQSKEACDNCRARPTIGRSLALQRLSYFGDGGLFPSYSLDKEHVRRSLRRRRRELAGSVEGRLARAHDFAFQTIENVRESFLRQVFFQIAIIDGNEIHDPVEIIVQTLQTADLSVCTFF